MQIKEELTFEERREVLKIMGPKILLPCFQLHCLNFEKEVNENYDFYYNLMNQAVEKLYTKIKEFQLENKIPRIAYISLFYLKSNVITRKNELFIQAFSQDLYFDPVEVSTDLSIDFIMKYLDEDMEFAEQYIREKMPDIPSVLLKELRNEYAGNLLQIVEKFVEYFALVWADHPLFQEIVKEDAVKVTFGGYYDKGRVLLEI